MLRLDVRAVHPNQLLARRYDSLPPTSSSLPRFTDLHLARCSRPAALFHEKFKAKTLGMTVEGCRSAWQGEFRRIRSASKHSALPDFDTARDSCGAEKLSRNNRRPGPNCAPAQFINQKAVGTRRM